MANCFMAVSSSKTVFSRMAFWNTVVRFMIKWLGGGLVRVIGLLVVELVLVELVLVELVLALVELVLSSSTFRLRTWLVGVWEVLCDFGNGVSGRLVAGEVGWCPSLELIVYSFV